MLRRSAVVAVALATAFSSFALVRPAAAAPGDPFTAVAITPTSVEAGSTGNNLAATFSVGSSSFRGEAAMRVPVGWTPPQRRDAAAPGHVSAVSSSCNQVSTPNVTGSGPWMVVVDVQCKAGTSFTLRYSNATAPTTAGNVSFPSGWVANGSGTFTSVNPAPVVPVRPGPARTLAVRGYPSPTTAGEAGDFTVVGIDRFGNERAPHPSPIALTSDDPQAALGGPLDLSTGTAAGSGEFRTAGIRSLTATSTTDASITGTQPGITVEPSALARIDATPDTATVPAGVPQPYEVTGYDAYGNTLGPVAASLSIAPDGSCTAADCTATTTGAHTVTAAFESFTDRAALRVVAADVFGLEVGGFPAAVAAGTPGTLDIRAVDRFGNTADYDGTVAVTSTDPQADLPAPIALADGLAQANVRLRTAGTQSLTATDVDMPALTATQSGIEVSPGALRTIGLSPATATVTAGEAVDYEAEGYDAHGNSRGPVTPTLSISPTGTCSGMSCAPTRAGAHIVTATLDGVTGTATLDVLVETVTVSPSTLPDAVHQLPYSEQLTAPGAVGTTAFTATGTLPPGLTLSPAGLLSGTPTTLGTFDFTVTATDANGISGEQAYSLVVRRFLEAGASSLSFGEVAETGRAVRTTTITNFGSSDVVLGSVTGTPSFGDFNLDFGADTCFTTDPLTPGETCTVALSFSPRTAGPQSRTLTYNFHRDSTPINVAFNVDGVGVPQLTASASALSFGEVPETGRAVRTATITNNGGRDVVLGSVTGTPSFGDFNLDFAADTCFTTDPLTPGETCTVALSFSPRTTGPQSRTLTYNFHRDSTPLNVAFNVDGTGVPQLTASASSLSFGEVPETGRAVRTATITNNGGRDVVLGSVTGTPSFGDFNLDFAADTCFTTDPLTPGETCTVALSFSPRTTGPQSRTLTYNFHRDSTPVNVAFNLDGTGVPQLTASASSLSFGEVPETGRAVRTATITNNGARDVVLGSVTGTPSFGDFNLDFGADTCFTTDPLTPGETCTVALSFSPRTTGPQSRTLTYNFHRDSTPLNVAFNVDGTGVPQLTASVSSLSFGEVPETGREVRTATITNNGGRDVVLGSVTGTPSFGDFNLDFAADTCFTTDPLTPGETCTVALSFSPRTTGPQSRTLTYNFHRDSTPINVAFNVDGVGVSQLQVSASSLSFGNVPETGTATRTATVTNGGTSDVVLGSVTGTPNFGAFNLDFGADTCFTTDPLTPGETCTVALTFSPTTTGPQSRTLTYNFHRGSSPVPLAFNVAGVGVSQLQVSASTLSFGNVPETGTATRTATVTNGGTSDVVLGSVTGTPNFGAFNLDFGADTCFTTDPLTPGETCTVALTFSPTTAGPQSRTLTYNFHRGSSPVPLALNVNGVGISQLQVSTSSLSFGEVPETGTATRTATVTNGGTSDVVLGSVTGTPNFGAFNLDFGADTCFTTDPLTPGETCTVALTFSPTTTGPQSRTLTYNFHRGSSPVPLAFNVDGVGLPQLTVSSTSLDFGHTEVGDRATRTTTITNGGTSDVVLGSVTGTPNFGDFNLDFAADTCFTTDPLTPGETCTVALTFSPTTTGAQSRTLTYNFHRNSTPLPVAIGVSGAGAQGVATSTSSLSFGQVAETSRAVRTATVTNRGTSDLVLGSVTGTPSFGDFNLDFGTDTCFTTDPLTPGETCTVALTFSPRTTGPQSRTLTYNFHRGSTPVPVGFNVAGEGIPQLQLSASSLSFGQTFVGDTTKRTATVTNRGGTDVVLGSVTGTPSFGDFNLDFGADTCFTTDPLTPGETCTVALTFSPRTAGVQSRTLTYNFQRSSTPLPAAFNVSGEGV